MNDFSGNNKNILHFLCIFILLGCYNLSAQKIETDKLRQKYNLGEKRISEEKCYRMQTKVITYSQSGKQTGKNTYKLFLRYVPSINLPEKDKYKCERFFIQYNDLRQLQIPDLQDWLYEFDKMAGLDSTEPLFGIEHSKFENLKTNDGKILSPEISYMVYNTFIDYHSFCDILTERTTEGKGIQDLKYIGERIIHDAAFTEPPVNLGTNIKKGSYFRNGEISLELIGISVIHKMICAIINFDSGESSFKMIMEPAPDMQITTHGSSHYFGDIYKNLRTNWVEKVIMNEFVISETAIPQAPYKVNSIIERSVLIEALSKEDFEKSLSLE